MAIWTAAGFQKGFVGNPPLRLGGVGLGGWMLDGEGDYLFPLAKPGSLIDRAHLKLQFLHAFASIGLVCNSLLRLPSLHNCESGHPIPQKVCPEPRGRLRLKQGPSVKRIHV